MPHKCPEKKKAYAREYYGRSADRRKKIYEAVAKRRNSIVAKFKEYKAGLKCIMCGENHPSCLEFHHVDPRTKDENPSELARKKGWSFDKIKEHIETTCLCLCANCHRKVHSKIRENPKPKVKSKRVQSTSRKQVLTKTRSRKNGSRPKSSPNRATK